MTKNANLSIIDPEELMSKGYKYILHIVGTNDESYFQAYKNHYNAVYVLHKFLRRKDVQSVGLIKL